MGRKLDLDTGTPVWSAYRAPHVQAAPLTRDVACDVLVVGLGISGAMVAEALTAQGLSVIGVDRRGPMCGSTRSTTALVQFEIDEPITSLSGKIGQAKAEQAWRRSRLAVTNLRGRIEQLGIACRPETRSSLFIAGNVLGAGMLREEAQARAAAGLRATYLTALALKEDFGIDRAGAILSDNNLALDPLKLTAGFLRVAARRKARFYAPVEVTRLVHHASDVVAETRQGRTITAGHVVLATGYELMDVAPSDTHSIISTYVIATKPQKASLWPGAAFIWEASDPYLYMRATHDGRVICGGEDEEFQDEDRRDALIPAKTERLAKKLKQLFPQLDTKPDFAWAGSFGSTTTGLPSIGPLPGRPRVFAVQGYGGNGITFSQIASELVATTIAGGRDTDAELFAFGRKDSTA
ncbi:NAD(P)/FAD-dependent oxidoreductase [Methylobacterium brachythecii]|uniref:FAD-dependent oxidoreductase n=1 Tax=Methylobacterium brachythecii TaxID=1176177 RepID=A0A7W6AHS0_9HYPH|nr:FAD-binding oxidoreductase [Methylobacterium brachythecii]MBB3902968.1 glycine/D-amino acid oxidase-like deaminating enzyme [Methylobacterium brachythecii]GLS46330.1 FAD-dependent oxidoreductase [Methylobacterium brachythecii]